MARDTRKAYEAELKRLRPGVRAAFLSAIADIRSAAKLSAVQEAVATGDWRAVTELLRIDERVFGALDQQIVNAFYNGGVYQLAHLSGRGAALSVRFQGRHPRAELWAQNRSEFITNIINEQRENIQDAVSNGLIRGQNPRQTALDIVGRIQGSRRTGGILGLSKPHARAVLNLKQELTDPSTAGNYFTREARDKRFDGSVRRAIAEGRGLSQSLIDRISGRYSDRLLRVRGEAIARTETIAALNAGRHEAIQQLIDRGEVSASAVSLQWSATMDGRTRDLHRALNGTVVDMGEPFISQTGAALRFPGDSGLGATGADVIQCRCYMQPKIDWLSEAS